MKVKDYILLLISENHQITKIRITNFYNLEQNPFDIQLENGTIIEIIAEIYNCEDLQVVEFYNSSNQLVARAKGFDSVL